MNKKQTKGLIFVVIFGGGLLFWATAASMPNLGGNDMMGEDEQVTITNTPMDNFADSQRPQFCGTGEFAKSTTYVTEYKIPTVCTQPVAITTDSQNNVWFAETNTGKVAKFDPITKQFTEYDNPAWPKGGTSMMWGIDYSPDNSLWFTDSTYDSIWKFSIDDQTYERINYPSTGDSLPQRLELVGSQIIVNDFTGNQITFLDPASIGEDIHYVSLPSPVEGSVTGGFAIDSQNNLWYTNWIFQTGGVLIQFDREKHSQYTPDEISELPISEFIEIHQFPPGMSTPNGISVTSDDTVWIADTSSSFFFSFDPVSETFTRYTTSSPPEITYGNASGLIKSPVSRPYWTAVDDNDNLVFNEQTANRIAVFEPNSEKLTEYLIPSKNPNWGDCSAFGEQLPDCGLAQAFGFTINGDEIWFTEWVENNIGVVDTAKTLPFSVDLNIQNITLQKGEQADVVLTINPNLGSESVSVVSSSTANFSDIVIVPSREELRLDGQEQVTFTIMIDDEALSGTHKVLLGIQNDEVTISQFVTVTIEK